MDFFLSFTVFSLPSISEFCQEIMPVVLYYRLPFSPEGVVFCWGWINLLFFDTWQSSPTLIIKHKLAWIEAGWMCSSDICWSELAPLWIWSVRTCCFSQVKGSSRMSRYSSPGQRCVPPLDGTVATSRKMGSFRKAYSASGYDIKGYEIRFLTECTYCFYPEFALILFSPFYGLVSLTLQLCLTNSVLLSHSIFNLARFQTHV